MTVTGYRSVGAAALVSRGRGLLALDQPCTMLHDVLRGARIPATERHCGALRELVLGTPGLDRLAGGLLVTPAALPAAVGRTPVGVRMDSREDASVVARHADGGATFAAVTVDGSPRRAAAWASACQRAGLVPLVEYHLTAGPHDCLAAAEAAHTVAIGALMAALHRAGTDPGGVLLGVRPVVPGTRSSEVDAAEDCARATVRSLRDAGACAVAGVVFSPPRRAGQLAAHLAAVQWLRPGWTVGFCLGASLLAPVAKAWRGRPERVAGARHELLTRLTCVSAVLRATGPPPAGGAAGSSA